jgi:arsenite methyltransferase
MHRHLSMKGANMAVDVREQVREQYAAAARGFASGCGCGCQSGDEGCCGEGFYDSADAEGLAEAAGTSLGCGNPVAVADLRAGETVLDLGSGGGLDVLLSGRRVGPTGTVYGLDMTDEMLALGKRNAETAQARNVHFLKGLMEAIPLPAESIDVVISNCVVNLSTDKRAVLGEIARVLRPGGRLGITDIVAEDRLTPEERADRGSYAGCSAGALSETELRDGLVDAGLEGVELERTHSVADGMHSAIIRARKLA